MIAFRDETVRRFGLELRTHTNPDGLRENINPFDHGGAYTQIMKTDALKQALTSGQYDFAIGGARRDEERSRAKERIFSVRAPGHAWDPKRQRPELWHLYNGQLAPGETMRVFPLSNWTELDVWTYIAAEGIDVVPLYFAAMRPTVMRGGQIIVVDDERMRFAAGRNAGAADGAVPVAGLLSAVRGGDLGCGRYGRAAGGDAGHAGLGARRAADRSGSGFLDGAQEARGVFLMPDSVLRVLTCGSVDDGKSTLIGRLLFECGTIPDDVMAALERDSKRFGTVEGGIDYALLVDGLEAEREQGVTIDVAYRFFETPARRFILADTPGHQQYTRNMVTGASTADLAVLLVDARKGILPQTRRHAAIASLLGIRQVVLAVNKMDLVDFEEAVFAVDQARFPSAAGQAGVRQDHADPDLCPRRRQCHRVQRADGLVYRPIVAARAGGRRSGFDPGWAVPYAGAIREPARPRISRLCRHDRIRQDTAGRPPHQRRHPHRGCRRPYRHHGRRSRRSRCRRSGYLGAGPGDRYLPR